MLHSLLLIPDDPDLEITAEVDPYLGRGVLRLSMTSPQQEDFLWALERLAMQMMRAVSEARPQGYVKKNCACPMPTTYYSPEGHRGHCTC